MKRGCLIFVSAVLAVAGAFFPLAAQDGNINYQTYMVDDFDSPDSREWKWHVVGSKFVTDGYPILKTFDGMPHAVRVMQEEPEKAKFIGIQVKFNRQGDNWIDVVPAKDGDKGLEPYEIPFRGIIHRLDVWVWGAGYYYDLEALVRDCNGRVHTLPMGMVNFKGWNNMSVKIPSTIHQASKYLGGTKQMSFVAFRLRTRPTEKVDDFYIFFDQFKALTNVYVDSYDGYELVKAEFDAENSTKTEKGEE